MRLQHNRPGTFPADEARARAELRIAKGVGELLHKHYRGHFWQVEADTKQGVCLITIPVLLENWKWKINLAELTPEAVVRAGGELLERFNIPRGDLDVARFVEARKHRVSRATQRPPGS